jgi:hypothetical protein
VTEAGFAHPQFDASAFASQSVRRDPQLPEICNFSLELAWPVMFENGLGLDTANSFLVIASPTVQTLVPHNELAYHYSTTRLAAYCKETTFAVNHAQEITVRYKRINRINGALEGSKPNVNHCCLTFICTDKADYVLGKSLAAEFIQIITKDGWTVEQVGHFIEKYLSILTDLASAEGFELNSSEVGATLPGHYVDCIPQNIIIQARGKPIFIDKEWKLNAHVEINHLVFRSLLFLCNSTTRFGQPANGASLTVSEFIKQVFEAANLVSNDLERLALREVDIQYAVSGIDAQRFFDAQKTRLLPLMAAHQVADQLRAQILELNQRISDVQASSSWQLTAPLRYFSAIIKKII